MIDDITRENMLAMYFDDHEVVQATLEAFLESAIPLIDEIAALEGMVTAVNINRKIHAIKGAVGAIGGQRAYEYFAVKEKQILNSSQSEQIKICREVVELCRKIVDQVKIIGKRSEAA